MSASPTFVRVTSQADIAIVAALADEIWHEYYEPLIGIAQVDYMVGKFQSEEAMARQMSDGYEYFLMQAQGEAVGYLAVQAQPVREAIQDCLFISKLYLRRSARGAGTGRAAMAFIEQLAQQQGLRRLWLTVNKGNPAVKTYERLGFQIKEAIVMDIGNGFVMDDFRMEKALPDG